MSRNAYFFNASCQNLILSVNGGPHQPWNGTSEAAGWKPGLVIAPLADNLAPGVVGLSNNVFTVFDAGGQLYKTLDGMSFPTPSEISFQDAQIYFTATPQNPFQMPSILQLMTDGSGWETIEC